MRNFGVVPGEGTNCERKTSSQSQNSACSSALNIGRSLPTVNVPIARVHEQT